jgi:sugar lactone lactonase YvrE
MSDKRAPEIRRIGTIADWLGESPVWCPVEQALYWVDIRAPALRRYDWASGAVESWTMPEEIGSIAVAARGGMLVALTTAVFRFDRASGALTRIADLPGHAADLRCNDGKCDRQGRFWVGTMTITGRAPRGTLYRIDDRGAVAQFGGITVPNSLAWSPDGRTMYFAESHEYTIWAFPFDPATGAIGPRRVFVRTAPPLVPDGATVDAEGFLWSANYGAARVTRFAPDGRVDRVLALPAAQITSCAFGGPDLGTLFVTSATQNLTPEQRAGQPLAGALFACEPGVRGLPEPRFAF